MAGSAAGSHSSINFTARVSRPSRVKALECIRCNLGSNLVMQEELKFAFYWRGKETQDRSAVMRRRRARSPGGKSVRAVVGWGVCAVGQRGRMRSEAAVGGDGMSTVGRRGRGRGVLAELTIL